MYAARSRASTTWLRLHQRPVFVGSDCVDASDTIILYEFIPRLRFVPPESPSIEEIGVNAHRRLGKFALRAKVEPAWEAKARGGPVTQTPGKGLLAFRIAARVETSHSSREGLAPTKAA